MSADPQLLAIFLEELDERTAAIERDLLAAESGGPVPDLVADLFREFHSLKGAAQAVGLDEVGSLCHELESLLASVRDGTVEFDQSILEKLLAGKDRLSREGAALHAGAAAAPHDVESVSGGAAASRADVPEGDAVVRVRSEVLDRIITRAGHVTIERRRALASAARIDEVLEAIEAWRLDWRRTGGEPQERAHDASVRLAGLAALTEGSARGTRVSGEELARASAALDEDLRTLRMQPFADATAGLDRAIRDVAVQSGKEVRLTVTGGEVELDRAVIARLRDALLHLVRNAVDHGIEDTAERRRAGKPQRASVTVDARLVGDMVAVSVADDGRGFDDEAVRDREIALGHPAPRDRADLARAVLSPGFSTRTVISEVSGRGVGLDAVRDNAERLGGRIELDWVKGQGSVCTLWVPLTLATTRGLLVRVGNATYAVPSAAVKRVIRIRASELHPPEHRTATVDGEILRVVALASVLSEHATAVTADILIVVILSTHAGSVGLIVDDALGEREIIARTLGRRFHGLPLLAGATILESGNVTPILAADPLVRAALAGLSGHPQPPPPRARRKRILVVDDSATSRSLMRSIVGAAGYEVDTAVNGEEAWKAIEREPPDAVVTDVEMPLLDGVALTTRIRAAAKHRGIPVVLVTSLGSAEDRTRGLGAGADAYIVKSQFDQDTLLEALARLA